MTTTMSLVPLDALDPQVIRYTREVHPTAKAMVVGELFRAQPAQRLEQLGQPKMVGDTQYTVYLTREGEGAIWVRVVIFRPHYGFGWAKMLAFSETLLEDE